MPPSSDHWRASFSGLPHRMSGKSVFKSRFASNSRWICLRNALAMGLVWLKIATVISGSLKTSWMIPAKVMIVDL
jgi:hypothetical protein